MDVGRYPLEYLLYDRMKYIEKEILSCLDEMTAPSSVCISAECVVCIYFVFIDLLTHSLMLRVPA